MTFRFSLILTLITFNLSAQLNSLKESGWEGTHSPVSRGTELYFYGDTMSLVDLDGITPPDLYLFRERNDTIELRMIPEFSVSCREEITGLYRAIRSNNGEKLFLKPIQDACIPRFTKLVSESPWFRKREKGEWQPDWLFLSPEKDNIAGVALYDAYRLLRLRQSVPVVVAVIDCPVDYSHPDLAPVMWKNPKEIPGNGKDDDGNLYRDDVRGWFFNCSRDGKTVDNEQPEATQIYQLFSRQFEGRDEKSITATERRDWISYQKAKQQFEKGRDKARTFEAFFSDSILLFSTLNDMMMQSEQPITPDQIDDWKVNDPVYGKAIKSVLKEIFLNRYKSLDGFIRKLRYELPELRKEYQSLWKCDFNPDCFPRAIVQDHPENPNERMYGCGFLNDPTSEKNDHGTHVAGIIGAKRDNGTGIEGIANNVQIMSLSAVPSEGDERDKDVANAIRYAADKGAKIINMSFAKRFSPHKKAVDDAIRYAEGKGVLFFHAAGNYHLDRDTAVFYPERNFLSGSAGNWIEVGNNQLSLDENLAAPSSNYGKKNVDLFAPGTDILSTYPGGRYETMTGTSMACPVAAGVAALIWSYFPRLTAAELKKILMESVYKADLKVKKPGSSGLVLFSSLSRSGGIINAKNAVIAADLLSRKKRRR